MTSILKHENDFFLEGENQEKAILLIHGLGGSPAEMTFLGKELYRKSSYTVYCPLIKGHGLGVQDLLKSTYKDWLDSVRRARLFLLEKGYKKIYAAGLCVGGSLILQVLLEEPKAFEALALYSLGLHFDGSSVPGWLKKVSPFLPIARLPLLRYFAKKLWIKARFPYGVKNDHIRSKILSLYTSTGTIIDHSLKCLSEIDCLNRQLEKRLSQIKVPVLALHARYDDMCHVHNMSYLLENLGGECEAHILMDSYHIIILDQERKRVAQLTQEFFKRY